MWLCGKHVSYYATKFECEKRYCSNLTFKIGVLSGVLNCHFMFQIVFFVIGIDYLFIDFDQFIGLCCLYLTPGHACPQSCGAKTGYMQYNDGDRVMQVKQFTPLYLTACAVMVQDYPSTNGAIPGSGGNHAPQGNGYPPGGPAPRQLLDPPRRNGQPPVPPLSQSPYRHSESSSMLNGGAAHHLDYDYDPSVIASKSSGSITKFMTSNSSVTPLSRKPSNSDVDHVFLISGTERVSPMGLDLNSNANVTAAASDDTTAEDRELAEVMSNHNSYAVEYGGGRVYARHYV